MLRAGSHGRRHCLFIIPAIQTSHDTRFHLKAEARNYTPHATVLMTLLCLLFQDHEFIPTRMKTIAASKPAANPTQFTRVTSNPLLISAQKQMLQVEEVKRAKQELLKQRSAGTLPAVDGPAASAAAVNDEPDWQSELSSWKTRRRKQSEETLMRVAEIKAMEKKKFLGML